MKPHVHALVDLVLPVDAGVGPVRGGPRAVMRAKMASNSSSVTRRAGKWLALQTSELVVVVEADPVGRLDAERKAQRVWADRGRGFPRKLADASLSSQDTMIWFNSTAMLPPSGGYPSHYRSEEAAFVDREYCPARRHRPVGALVDHHHLDADLAAGSTHRFAVDPERSDLPTREGRLTCQAAYLQDESVSTRSAARSMAAGGSRTCCGPRCSAASGEANSSRELGQHPVAICAAGSAEDLPQWW